MKTLLAVTVAAMLLGCAEEQSNTTGYSGSAALGPRTGPAYYSPENSPFRKWSTAQLQRRRRDLYARTPQIQTRRGQPAFIHHEGEGVSQGEKELYAIEAELNRRYQAGDKEAELKRAIPGEQHPG